MTGSFSMITDGLASCDLVRLVDAKVGICDRNVGIFDLEVDDDVELEELEVGNGRSSWSLIAIDKSGL